MKQNRDLLLLFIAVVLVICLDLYLLPKKGPSLELKGSLEISKCPNDDYYEEGYEARDFRNQNISHKVLINVTDDQVIYTVKDGINNETTKSRKLINIDTQKPRITLIGSDVIRIEDINEYNELGYSAYDNCDGEITNQVTVTNNIVTNNEIVYEVTDEYGNVATRKRKVFVVKDIHNTGTIYLTFDDGPSNKITANILDTLKSYDIKATFFVTGSGPDSLIKRAYDEGHTMGLHTYSHRYQDIYANDETFFNDFGKISNRIFSITKHDSKIFRFAGGSSNTISRRYNKGIISRVAQELTNQGYRYFDWHIDSDDAKTSTTTDDVYYQVINNLTKNTDNIVLMHDNKSKTNEALPKIIKYAIEEGYYFKPITLSTKEFHHKINN